MGETKKKVLGLGQKNPNESWEVNKTVCKPRFFREEMNDEVEKIINQLKEEGIESKIVKMKFTPQGTKKKQKVFVIRKMVEARIEGHLIEKSVVLREDGSWN